MASKQRKNRIVAAVAEAMETRRLFSGVFEMGGRLAFSAGGHGVSTDMDDIARHFKKRDTVSTSVAAPAEESDAAFWSDVRPYSDPNNPHIIGIDKDGLVVVRQDDTRPGTLPEPPSDYAFQSVLRPYTDPSNPHITGIDEDGLVVTKSIDTDGPVLPPPRILYNASDVGLRPSASLMTDSKSQLSAWINANPARTDEHGLRVVKSLPPDLAKIIRPIAERPSVDNNGMKDTPEIYWASDDEQVLPESGLQPAGIGYGLNIVLNKSGALSSNSAASTAFDRAVSYVESLFDNPVTIYIDADYSGFNDPGIIGGATPIVRTGISYSSLRTALTNGNANSIVDQLPTSQPEYSFNSQTTFEAGSYSLTNANSIALGLGRQEIASEYGGVRKDAKISFNNEQLFDFDPSNGVNTNSYDFYSTAVHELMHALGMRTAVNTVDQNLYAGTTSGTISPYPLDLFRLKPDSDRSTSFTTSPRILATGKTAGSNTGYAYPVTFDGTYNPSGITFGKTLSTGDIPMSTGFLTGDGRQASHWKDDDLINREIGIMDPTANLGDMGSTRRVDQSTLALIGWDPSGVSSILSNGGTLDIIGTSGSNNIAGAVSTNTSGDIAFSATVRAGSVTAYGYFDNSDINGVFYDARGGNDTIVGSTRNELIYGGDGDDNVDANAGADTVYGGIGNDFLSGSSQSDRIFGEDGEDSLGGGNGNDSLYGGNAIDLLEGGADNDSIRGDSGVDRMFGNAGDDTFDAQDSVADGVINGGTENDGAYMDDEDDQPGVITFSVGRIF
ncbi:MAG TPA: NF038122 family metalloprotease [Tepidisphaeraceae bacterium]|jgi:Ca2+-binding RTX toxin-like protein